MSQTCACFLNFNFMPLQFLQIVLPIFDCRHWQIIIVSLEYVKTTNTAVAIIDVVKKQCKCGTFGKHTLII